MQRGNYCYQLFTPRVGFATAVQNCVDIGAILAEPRTLEEDTAITQLSAGNFYWIGLTTTVAITGPWTWESDGQEAVWTNWHPSQPNDNIGYCVYVNHDIQSQWSDIRCDRYQYSVVCQTGGR